MTSSQMRDVDRLVPVRVDYSKARQKYAKGGLAESAEDVRKSGRGGDDMVVHVNKREFDEMRRRWGDPTINPDTKLPEFFIGDLLGGIGDLITSGSSYIPGIGEGLSSWFGSNPTAAQSVGTGLLGAGLGQLFGGNTKSTLMGAGIGALVPSAYNMFSGAGSPTGTVSNGSGYQSIINPATGELNVNAGAADGAGSSAAKASGLSGLWANASPANKMMAGLVGALTLASMVGGARGPNKAQKQAAAQAKAAQDQFNRKIPAQPFDREFTPPNGMDLTKYGFGGQPFGGWFANNKAPINAPAIANAPEVANGPRYAARGGRMMSGLDAATPSRFVQGPGGAREDKIPAMLSNNEYVVDAETTALLGDGDPAVGAKKLDAMRSNIRKHKGAALSRGKISPDAMPAEHYLGGKV